MDFDDTPEDAVFRTEVRAWLAKHAPRYAPPPGEADAEGFALLPLARQWQTAKAEAGYARIGWPVAYGGRGGSVIQEVIFDEEQRRFPLPPDAFGISLGMCITTLLNWAAPEVLERFVAPALRGEEIWCQLFSEPSAGSDLGNVRTRAVRDGDDWIVTGQKVWTTGAHVSDWGTILVRTDPGAEKYAGLSYFWFDMRSPGVEVRPIRQASGHAAFNEVFLTDVRIPDSQRLGEVGGGWKVAISTLLNERMSVNEADIANITIDDVVAMARKPQADGRRPIDDAASRSRLASLYVRSLGVRYSRYRMLTRLAQGEEPGPEAAMGKLVLGRNIQDMARFAMEMRGPAGIIVDRQGDPELTEMQEAWLYAAGLRIAGGTDEILRNTIAERVLGLPQETRLDRGIPFNQLSS
ncbi:acyl-CoA dehydrogenase family protein [Sphingobium phenoxybenzoativorans]|uniref:Acyl-CoA dehydrogenase family protein n=1 Tax=Sphingobium phenoxybenzoativorans TaxID=1592790 RepID=A0A975K8E2_9SPHN|nr:acyl-CoA dehydrogenase family protein [Sphingobium phenoxybenzoativorans]QUT06705.1 acyl-CoA dehydrogenase family protein [Sphingobium phenoxybenzoativorans]